MRTGARARAHGRFLDALQIDFTIDTDALVDLQLEPEGEAPIRFATFAVFLDVKNEVAMASGPLETETTLDLRMDLADAPLFPIDEESFEGLLVSLLQGLGEGAFGGSGGLIPLNLQGLTNLELTVEGTAADYLSIRADLQ